ncbi:MAG: VOC family protein, partial [Chloroflexi bacterium]|nr:VOC family protein [Chloroflexota bacterium]
MEVKELGHVVLFVADVERSRHFYTDVLGFSEIRREGQRPNTAMYSTGRTHHELYLMQVGEDAQPVQQGKRLGLYHIGIKIGTTDEELQDAL